ncbi:GNAT family N-acetyltransferase [Flagellimonas sp. S174]|uniref:GNAT family N-acetyltransferase n=1 Tax=Flagellimonas sp. S174 TaxID=3410790 RepID=UPI003BF5CED7
MNKISYKKAGIDDSIRISVLLKTVYIEVYATEGITFEFANFIEKRFSNDHIKKIIKNNPDQFLIAYYDDNPIGVAELLFNSNCPIRKISTSELSKLYVLKRFNGKGIGYGLMLASEKLLKEKGFKELNLEVYIGNAHAISFYEKLGYQKIGKVDFPMEKNIYENWVMNKKLK